MSRWIDLDSWYRKKAYDFFKGFEDPFFNLTAHIPVDRLVRLSKSEGLSISAAMIYYAQLSATSIPEFRTRIRDEGLIEHERVEATSTLLQEDESFTFCYYESRPNIVEYCQNAREVRKHYLELNSFDVEADRDDLIYYSFIPWVSFTSFKHASRFDSSQSVPRIVFGKFYEDNGIYKVPLSVEANHIVMDGIHVGRFFERIEERFDSCSIDD